MKYTLPKLPYAYNALEPAIDAKTMEIHYTKHHQSYIDKLNDAMQKYTEIAAIPIEKLLLDLSKVPEDIRIAVRNHGGGHVNHTLFWEILSPQKQEIMGKIKKEIEKTFGSFDKFKEQFSQAAMTRFGSGWAWLVITKEKKLKVYSTANQDSPLMEENIPILGLDVWEHAYYVKYMWNRAEYVRNWWNVVNWTKVNELLEKAML